MITEVQLRDDWCKHGQNNQGDLDPIKEEPQHKDQAKQQEQQTPWTKTHRFYCTDDQIITAKRAKNIAKEGRANEQAKDHRVGLCGAVEHT